MRIAGINLGAVRAPLNTISKNKLALIVPELEKLEIIEYLSK